MTTRAGTDWRALRREAHARFGISHFRPGQQEIIQAALTGRDVVGIMPTGAGKSLCYQLPALFLPQATVVVSPLISLMQDQQEKMADIDVRAAKLDSTLSAAQERQAVKEIERGESSLVYVTPERLENPDYLQLLKQTGVSLLVVDEAHCVSQWGHDFRPAYLNVREAVRALGRPPVMALTATATSEVLADIRQQLALDEPRLINTGIDRPNLWFEVFRTVNDQMKRERVLELVREQSGRPGAGILYTATVKQADELWEWLSAQGVRTARYHAKRPNAEREETQQGFMVGEYEVIVATKAFGMGIDKPDIRVVIHYNFPDSLESYYQEAGRAGRDGLPARATLLYRLEDRRIQSYFLGGKYPRRDQSRQVFEVLSRLTATAVESGAGAGTGQGDGAGRGDGAGDGGDSRRGRNAKSRDGGVTVKALVEASGLPERKVKVIVALLDSAGLVQRGRRLRKLREFDSPEEVESFLEAYEQRHQSDRDRLQAMMRYAEQTGCRLGYLRAYFGDDGDSSGSDGKGGGSTDRCGHCDNCQHTAASTAVVADEVAATSAARVQRTPA